MINKKRLIWQIYPSFLLIILLSLTATIWVASRTLKSFIIEHYTSDLNTLAHVFESQFKALLSPPDMVQIDRLCKRIGEKDGTHITIILPSGQVAGDSDQDPKKMDNHLDRPEVIQAIKGELGVSIRFSLTLKKDMIYLAVPIRDGSDILGVLRTGTLSKSVDDAIGNIREKIIISGIIISILSAIICLLMSQRISRPIEEIRKGVESLARGELTYRLPDFSSREMEGLAQAVTQIAKELNDRINIITQQRNQLEQVFSGMVEGVLAVDLDERIIHMNNSAKLLLDCSQNNVQGLSIQELIRNVDLQRFIKEAVKSNDLIEEDILLHFPFDDRVINCHGTAICDSSGKCDGALIVLNDVTRLRRLENIRRDFVANVSHEIKTPVTAIKGFAQTLRDGVKDEDSRERFLEIIEKHTDRLITIIDDLLSLSRVEEGTEKDEIVLQAGHIEDIIYSAGQLCEAKASQRKIRIEIVCEYGLTCNINRALLEQAIINLLDNAVKYSEEGGTVLLKAGAKGDEIVIEVVDQGCGIERKHLDRLFERFYRVDKARSRNLGGTGLGLSIVKHIIQAHGGNVTVDSSPGKGSTFSIHLPKG
ncbi:PAS domain S-box protein [uncultured Desulfobacterium sp.]|uniref:histidine kinase n=1 Tax=uncultured Desulfobacterium sp. TaxID=201089 RepID=A0A445MWS7_9BACT|nr:PAS domain S-box protein [uncultured Desulfobacterium sp.]